MIISSLVAMNRTLLIGKDNDLPWHLKDDLAHFKNYSMNKPIVMGRNTYESIGRPLPNRYNIVISTTFNKVDGAVVVNNLPDAIEAAKKYCIENNQDEIVIIGGAKIFALAKDMINKLVITWVEANELVGDVYYPSFSLENWVEQSQKPFKKNADNDYDFVIKEYLLKK
ncbi:MAG: dihydrofolate reductase [Proteobacteria bacterium]|nr:dihydrofolate reductase [SAR86 cluster bacterium]MDA0344536.1 dihydrofolate reductase [Pseudomonadota bacterium]MDA0899937.1 dihydrofolate reductase [Pseudomonadota bacterium]MDA1056406.1 dihydrofolate reductase [Pseudomonadota bacterium]